MFWLTSGILTPSRSQRLQRSRGMTPPPPSPKCLSVLKLPLLGAVLPAAILGFTLLVIAPGPFLRAAKLQYQSHPIGTSHPCVP